MEAFKGIQRGTGVNAKAGASRQKGEKSNVISEK